MDGLTALGVASNVIQLVSFASKLVGNTHSIYRSATGTSDNVVVLNDVASALGRLTDAVVIAPECGEDLKELSLTAKRAAQQLLDVLEALRVRTKKTRWKSFLVAAKQVYKADQIESLTTNLSRLQMQILLHLQSQVGNQLRDISMRIEGVEMICERLDLKRTSELERLRHDILAAVQSLASNALPANGSALASSTAVTEALENLKLSDPERIPAFLGKVSAVQKQLTDLDRYHTVLQRLHFDDFTSRHDKVLPAHATTFQWIFQDGHPDGLGRLGFSDWLRKQGGIFWIRGKAGSGKSTLLKFLGNHPLTIRFLQEWAKPRKLVLAKFYFWNSGTRLQKSQEGLLRSLLFEILRQCPELGHHFWAKSQTFLDTEVLLSTLDVNWTTGQLGSLLKCLVTLDRSKSFCFIIDGLDEYQVDDTYDHRDLIKTLRELSAWLGIKFCVSSRPWTVFVDAFGGAPDQVLKLEDLTREDVRRYASDKFNEHDQYRKLSQFDPGYRQLVDEVVRRAQGVFLWVFLVVRDLLEGLTYNDTMKTMRRRLDGFPETLEAFFQHMLSSVPKFYRIQTARAFQVATSVDYPLPMVMYSFLNDIEDDPEIVDREIRRPCGGPEIKQRQDTMRRRFDAWCKGLLEVGTFGQRNGYGSFQNDRVDFLHRTVRDFLVSENVQGITNLLSEERRQTWIGLCQAVVLQFKRAPENTFPPTTDCLDELCHFARNAICDGAPIGLIYEILEKVIDAANAVESLASTGMREEVLASACQNGLSGFVQSQFDYYASGQPLRPSQLTEIFRQAVKPGPISGKIYADNVASIIKYGESSDYDMEQSFFSVFGEVVAKIGIGTKRDGVVELVKLMVGYGYPIEKDWVEKYLPGHVIELMMLSKSGHAKQKRPLEEPEYPPESKRGRRLCDV